MMSSLREFYILIVMPVGNPVIGALLNLEPIQPGLILPAQLNLVLYLTGVEKQTSLKQRLHRGEQKLFQRYTLVADEKFF